MGRFEIFLSTRRPDGGRLPAPAGRFGRLKGLLAALLFASAFIGFLIAALVLGSIFAIVLIVLFAVAFTVALVRRAIGASHRQTSSRTRQSG